MEATVVDCYRRDSFVSHIPGCPVVQVSIQNRNHQKNVQHFVAD